MYDRGARNLLSVFLGVWGILTLFYAFLAWRSIIWSPAFYIKNEYSERSKVTLVFAMKLPTIPTMPTLNAADDISSVNKVGKSLYLRSWCALCHGPDGKGGVKSENYVKDTIPALNTLAEKMLIWEQADAEKLISFLAANKPLLPSPPASQQVSTLTSPSTTSPWTGGNGEVGNGGGEGLDLPNIEAVVAQYQSVRDVIEQGQVGGKKDPSGPSPIDMPAWKQTLSRRDIDLIISYLLSLYQWEEEE